jgi:hypothetical protein
MPNLDTAERTAQLETLYKRDVSPSYRQLQAPLRIASFGTITITADSDAANDTISLGTLGCGGRVIPELCRIVGTSGIVGGTFKVQKVASDGTATDITGTAAISVDETAVAFTRKAGAATGAAFAATDYLRLFITAAGALTAGDTVELYIAYSSDQAS